MNTSSKKICLYLHFTILLLKGIYYFYLLIIYLEPNSKKRSGKLPVVSDERKRFPHIEETILYWLSNNTTKVLTTGQNLPLLSKLNS